MQLFRVCIVPGFQQIARDRELNLKDTLSHARVISWGTEVAACATKIVLGHLDVFHGEDLSSKMPCR